MRCSALKFKIKKETVINVKVIKEFGCDL